MKLFFQSISQLITNIGGTDSDTKAVDDDIKDRYQALSLSDQIKALSILTDAFENDISSLYLLFYHLLFLLDSETIFDILVNSIFNSACTTVEKLSYFHSISNYTFCRKPEFAAKERFVALYNQISASLKDASKIPVTQYPIPKVRFNHPLVLFLIQPFLSPYHAPSKILVNLVHYYHKLGYQTFCISTSLKKCEQFYFSTSPESPIMNSLSDDTTHFNLSIMGEKIEGINYVFSPLTFLDEIKSIKEKAFSLNPSFIFSIGDKNVVADILSDYYIVATFVTTSSSTALCNSQIIIDTFHKKPYTFCNITPQNIFFWEFHSALTLPSNTVSRNDLLRKYGIGNSNFIIAISGSRLNDEITREYVDKIISPLLREYSHVVFLFVGVSSLDFISSFETSLASRCICTGYVQDYAEVVQIAHLHLNPIRTGGCSGPARSLDAGIPVVTLDECDSATVVGKAFVSHSLDEYYSTTIKYLTDNDYYARQSMIAKERSENRKSNEEVMVKQIKDLNTYLSVYSPST